MRFSEGTPGARSVLRFPMVPVWQRPMSQIGGDGIPTLRASWSTRVDDYVRLCARKVVHNSSDHAGGIRLLQHYAGAGFVPKPIHRRTLSRPLLKVSE